MLRNIQYVLLLVALAGFLISCGGGSGEPPTRSQSDVMREESILADRQIIQDDVNALGGWNSWWQQVQPFHDGVQAKIDHTLETGFQAYIGEDDFLFTRWRLRYMVNRDLVFYPWGDPRPAPEVLIDVSEQLRARGIDLIVLPVPTRAEVYPDKVVAGTSTDIPMTPQRTAMIQALLEADVEVVDLLPLYRQVRDTTQPLVSRHADPHWGNGGTILAAQDLAIRLQRYPEIVEAGTQTFTTQTVQGARIGALINVLSPEDAAIYVEPPYFVEKVLDADAMPYQEVADSPILVMGDSYTKSNYDVPGDLAAHLAFYLGMPITRLSKGGGGPIMAKLLAEQGADYINQRRVIIWVYVVRYMSGPQGERWVTADLP